MLAERLFCLGKQDAVEELAERAASQRTSLCCSLNAYTFYHMSKDPFYAKVTREAEIALADGTSAFVLARLQGLIGVERIPGCDLIEPLLAVAAFKGWPVLLIGPNRSNLERLRLRFLKRWPDLPLAIYQCVSAEGPGDDLWAMAKAWQPRIIFVGFAQPYQELLMRRLRVCGAGLVMGVGGAFDVLSGRVRQTPVIMRKVGLEWLYRFFQKPVYRFRKTAVSIGWFPLWAVYRLIAQRR